MGRAGTADTFAKSGDFGMIFYRRMAGYENRKKIDRSALYVRDACFAFTHG